MDYKKIGGVYIPIINITETEDEMELIIDVDKNLIVIDNTCANFSVEKCVNLLCQLKKNVIFVKGIDGKSFNSSKIVYHENKSELLIVR